MLIVNGRYRGQRLSGVQRVARELESRLTSERTVLTPSVASGPAAYAWEQAILPFRARGELLWSPCNLGPVACRNQVVTIHDAAVFDHPEWFSRAFVRANTAIWSVLARRVRQIVTVSHFSQARLSDALGIPLKRIEVVWNGVNESFQPALAAECVEARAAVGLSPEQPYFATLSTIEPRKNLNLVVKAFRSAQARLPQGAILLVIGGQGSNAIFGASAPLAGLGGDGILMSGHVPDRWLAPLLSGSLGVLYPSLYEGFGLPVIEAMASGAPVVTTRLASLGEVGGDVALYVDPSDPDDMAKVLIRLAGSESLRQDLREMGLARAQQFSWPLAARKMDEIFARHA